jgi:ABC-type phosphate/phosphonate transport system substrate-binding protein
MRSLLIPAVFATTLFAFAAPVSAADKSELTVIVMDPLSAELSCPCVDGYAQRDYGKFGKYLEKALGRPVKVHFSESLANTLQKKTEGKADLIIGKESVVRNDAADSKLAVAPIAALTGKDGKTTMTGLFVVGGLDPALTITDLKGYRILFGLEKCDEKHAAALKLMKDFGMKPEGKLETCPSCSTGATKVVEGLKGGEKIATVISSYAVPILEGCGTIKKGDVRVIGETESVPFIVAFANGKLSSTDREAIQQALFAVAKDADLCKVMETKLGFVKFAEGKKK